MPRSGPARLAPYKRLKSGGRDDSGRISRVPRWRGHKAIPRQQDVVFLVWTGPWLAAEAGALVRSRASRYRRLIVRPYPHRCGGAKSSGSQAHRSCLSGFMRRRGPVRGDPRYAPGRAQRGRVVRGRRRSGRVAVGHLQGHGPCGPQCRHAVQLLWASLLCARKAHGSPAGRPRHLVAERRDHELR